MSEHTMNLPGRIWTAAVAYIALAIGAGLSIAGNVADTFRTRGAATDALDIVMAVAWPALVVLMVEMFVSSRWTGQGWAMQVLRWTGCLSIGAMAMRVSWVHLNDLMESRGQHADVATLGPLAIDALAIMATALILSGRGQSRTGQRGQDSEDKDRTGIGQAFGQPETLDTWTEDSEDFGQVVIVETWTEDSEHFGQARTEDSEDFGQQDSEDRYAVPESMLGQLDNPGQSWTDPDVPPSFVHEDTAALSNVQGEVDRALDTAGQQAAEELIAWAQRQDPGAASAADAVATWVAPSPDAPDHPRPRGLTPAEATEVVELMGVGRRIGAYRVGELRLMLAEWYEVSTKTIQRAE